MLVHVSCPNKRACGQSTWFTRLAQCFASVSTKWQVSDNRQFRIGSA